MVLLSEQSEALAREIALAQGISVEEAILRALELSARDIGFPPPPPRKRRDTSPEAIAARKARIEAFAAELAKMPILDPRSPQEIIDDLNEL